LTERVFGVAPEGPVRVLAAGTGGVVFLAH